MVFTPRTEFAARPGRHAIRRPADVSRGQIPAARPRPPIAPTRASHPPSAPDRDLGRRPPSAASWASRCSAREAEHREEKPLELLIAPTSRWASFTSRSDPTTSTATGWRSPATTASSSATRGRRSARRPGAAGTSRRSTSASCSTTTGCRRRDEEAGCVEQASFREYLASRPDPLAGGDPVERPVPERVATPPPTACADDAMYAFSRYLQTQAYRAQKRRDEGAEARKSQKRALEADAHPAGPHARLRRIESSLWWRLRPRVPKACAGAAAKGR